MAEFKLGRIRFIWKGSWTDGTDYLKDDVVRVGGRSYVCITGHTSSAAFYTDTANWSLMVDGQTWQGEWADGVEYSSGDIVNYGGSTFICINGHVSDTLLENNNLDWEAFASGIDFKGVLTNGTYYKVNDVVKWGASLYICITAHTTTSVLDDTKFALFVEGLQFEDSWSGATQYQLGDIVTYGGYAYVAIDSNLNQTPSTATAYWDLLTTGFKNQGDWSSATSYKTGDVVRVGGYTYVAILDNLNFDPASNPSKWELLNTGIKWQNTWADATGYKLGDAVVYGGSSYICIAAHTSATINRPDNDVLGTYWNALAEGSATNVMTTLGDLVYYGAAGNARLGVGSEGQVLKTSSGVPAWEVYGQLNDVYYVAPTGTDDTSHGYTIDKPWQTVAYACEQIAAGPGNPNARFLLNANKNFMIKEVNNYMLYTYRAIISGTSGNAFTTASTTGLRVGMPISISQISRTATQTYATQTLTISSSTGTDITVSASMSGVVVNQPIVFSSSFGNIAAGSVYYVQYASGTTLRISLIAGGTAFNVDTGGTGTASVQGTLVLNSTYGLTASAALSFTGVAFGGLSTATTYYVSNIINSTLVTLSATPGGSVITGITASTGTLTLNMTDSLTLGGSPISSSTTYYVQAITPGTSFTVASAHSGPALVAAGTGTAFGTFDYDTAKAERDTDYVIDGIIYDLGRGGNNETVNNAFEYFSDENTFTTVEFGYMVEEVIGSMNYLSTLLDKILSNVAPTNNYQTLNVATPIVSQTINLSYTTEAGTIASSQGLVGIVSNALDVGTTSAIPAKTKPNITLNLKTGTYSEVLPIVVPAYTSLVGDELRSVIVQPYTFSATATTSVGTSLTVSDATGILANMGIYGNPYIPDGTYVQTVVGNVLTLSQATTGAVTGPITVGYSMSNMFLMRDGTIARNMTVKGLSGSLSAANSYGTQRPTAGAYFSLDPGTGPDDETAWITTRSPYMQNVTLFGTGCVGMKVDGALHDGGNRSMVANDFTNILSDGIAIWAKGLSLVEAVSVFSYYGYAGYLTEEGGHIRATNGNSSYGTYGVVAEGSYPLETLTTGTVNTRSEEATVTNVLLSGGEIQWVEYSNAGQSYSGAVPYTITSGSGISAAVSSPNFYTNAVNEVRIVNGGSGYVTATNIAQTGGTTGITLSAADGVASGSYNGMRIVLTQGTGAGQYGFIDYNNGSNKQVIVLKESFVSLSTVSCTTTVFNVTDTTTIPVGTPIVFQGTAFGNVTNHTIYYVIASNFTSTTFSVSTSLDGPIVSLSASSGSMNIYQVGWDVAVTGTSVITTLDGTTRYIIEPRITFSSGTGTGALARAVVSSNQISAIRIINPGTGYLTPPTITITDPNRTSAGTYSVQTAASGVLGQPTWSSRGTGYSDASVTISGNGFADFQPVGFFVHLENLTDVPLAGSNITFAGNSTYYSIVQVINYTGTSGDYDAYVQINPGFTVTDAPIHGIACSLSQQYSQSRLTGHDFLYVGSGNYFDTGFPQNFTPVSYIQDNQTLNSGGGRVFFTSTDQDGNFNVGDLFVVQQATGVATLSANLFNVSGLNNLQFASGGANVTQFSTDGTMTANSDSLVPTQRAIRAYIANTLGAGGSNISANSVTVGDIILSGTTVTTQNSQDLTITTQSDASVVTFGSQTQISIVPSESTDITNKTYVDSSDATVVHSLTMDVFGNIDYTATNTYQSSATTNIGYSSDWLISNKNMTFAYNSSGHLIITTSL